MAVTAATARFAFIPRTPPPRRASPARPQLDQYFVFQWSNALPQYLTSGQRHRGQTDFPRPHLGLNARSVLRAFDQYVTIF